VTDSDVYVQDGKWHHVGMVNYDDGGTFRFKFYVDGVEDDTIGTSGSTDTDCDLAIGKRFTTCPNTGTSSPFLGLIDDVRIYNRALSVDEINRLYNLGR